VHPTEAAGDPRAGLVEVRDRRAGQQLAQALVEVAQPGRRRAHPRGQRAGRHRRAGQIAEQLAGALEGQMLKDVQVDPERADPRPVLRRRADTIREAACADTAAVAAPPLSYMLNDPQQRALGQIEHLPRLTTLN
jgi:hypothetical protein